MDTMMKPVQNGRGRRRQWSSEQKLTVLQEWQAGVLLEEICRKYAVNAAQMYRWKRSLDQGLKESGKLVPKSLVGGLQKRVDELERALGRKALEVDVLKKPSSSRRSNYPRKHTVVNAHNGLLRGHGLPSLRQAAEVAVLSTAIAARATAPAPRARRERPATPGSQPHLLRLSADPCTAQAARGGVQSQNSVASTAATGVALDQSETHHPVWAATRRAGTSVRTQSALGVRHYQDPSVGWTEGPLGHHDRLRRPRGIGVAVCHAHDGRRSHRDAAGGYMAPLWGSADPRTRDRIPQRQWAGVRLASVSAVRASHGTHPLSHAPAEPGVKRFGGSVLWELQAGLCLSGVSRDGGRRSAATPGVDQTLQSPGPAQRLGDAVASRVLCGVASQKQDSPVQN